jgi:hypothetical protein
MLVAAGVRPFGEWWPVLVESLPVQSPGASASYGIAIALQCLGLAVSASVGMLRLLCPVESEVGELGEPVGGELGEPVGGELGAPGLGVGQPHPEPDFGAVIEPLYVRRSAACSSLRRTSGRP